MFSRKTHFSPLTTSNVGNDPVIPKPPRGLESEFHNVRPVHISVSGVSLQEFEQLCSNTYLNLGLTPNSVKYLYKVVAGKRSWELKKGRAITAVCQHAINLECGVKYEITDQVREIPYLCLAVEQSASNDGARLATGELYLFRTSEGVSLEVSLDPLPDGKKGKKSEVGPSLWAPFSLVGHAAGLSEPLVDGVFRARELATYQRTEDADSWLVDLNERVTVTVVSQRETLKLPLKGGEKVLVPTEVTLLNTQKLQIKGWERSILEEMRLASTVTHENGGILRAMRDYCAHQAPLGEEVLARLRAATAQGSSVDVYAYEVCQSEDQPYRATELSTDRSIIQVRMQSDEDGGSWTEPVAHFEWDVPRIVTRAFIEECKSSCRAVAKPFLSTLSLKKVEEGRSRVAEDPRWRTFGEVRVVRGWRREVALPPIHNAQE